MNNIISLTEVRKLVNDYVGGVIHKKQSESLGNAVFAAMMSPRLGISALGRMYAQQTGKCPKHTIKQMDKLIGNTKISITDVLYEHVRIAVAHRQIIVVTFDWTEYDSVDQSRIAVNQLSRHGRATPLLWLTVKKSGLRKHRTAYEKKALRLLKECLPEEVQVIVLADRGFCSTTLFKYIQKRLKWDFVIRLRGNVRFFDDGSHSYGPSISSLRLIRGGKIRHFTTVKLTERKYGIQSLVAVHAKEMKEPWYLASTLVQPESIVKLYGRRFTCEEQFRDEKDDRFGQGTKEIKVGTLHRRDMLTLVHTIATFFLTIIGEAGERLGYHKKLQANTVKQRTHSLYRQGREYCRGVMKDYVTVFRRMIETVLEEHHKCKEIYGVI
jgi:hypothetical protein